MVFREVWISSKTGFQGDIGSYQISAPVQPGNSGGPLFDSQGNLIGIINAKHIGAENASYAVKSRYLLNLMDLLSEPPEFPSKNLLVGKSLPSQVEIVKKFVYIIEVNWITLLLLVASEWEGTIFPSYGKDRFCQMFKISVDSHFNYSYTIGSRVLFGSLQK